MVFMVLHGIQTIMKITINIYRYQKCSDDDDNNNNYHTNNSNSINSKMK